MKSSAPYDTQTLRDLEAAHSWRPFTPMRQYLASEPVVIERAQGVKLCDTDGNWYYDGVSSVWLAAHGHGVGRINDAVREQLDKAAHTTTLGQANVPSILLAKRLADVAPDGLTRTHFSDAGATAVEIAIKTAIQYWANNGKPKKRAVLGFEHNYHGDTMGAMAVAADGLFHWAFLDMLPAHPKAPYPVVDDVPLVGGGEVCDAAAVEPVEAIVRERAAEIAAVIVEPVQGAGGIRPAQPGFLHALRKICDEHGVLLIVDEVATGFGRTGAMFACDPEGITPDILCLGKAISGGCVPLAATMTTEAVYGAFLGDIAAQRTLYHGHSYAGNQIACAAALASLDLFGELLPALPEKTRRIEKTLSPLRGAPFVGAVRQRGLMAGIELSPDPTDSGASFPWHERVGYRVAEAARRRGMLLRPIGSVVVFMPPLVATDEELDEMTEILAAALHDAAPALARTAAQGARA